MDYPRATFAPCHGSLSVFTHREVNIAWWLEEERR